MSALAMVPLGDITGKRPFRTDPSWYEITSLQQ